MQTYVTKHVTEGTAVMQTYDTGHGITGEADREADLRHWVQYCRARRPWCRLTSLGTVLQGKTAVMQAMSDLRWFGECTSGMIDSHRP